MAAEMVAAAWMYTQISADAVDEQRAAQAAFSPAGAVVGREWGVVEGGAEGGSAR